MKKAWTVLCLISPLIGNAAWAQDLYDKDHTKQYAAHLVRTEQYEEAVNELERLYFMEPSDSVQHQLLLAFRMAHQYKAGLARAKAMSSIGKQANYQVMTMLLLNHQPDSVITEVNKGGVKYSPQLLKLVAMLQKHSWDSAFSLIKIANIESPQTDTAAIQQIIKQGKRMNHKSPFLALCLSIVPGLGKLYTGDYKDAGLSALGAATGLYQAYSGFSKMGVNSVYGWTFAAITAGFYVGNIYGGYKSAIRYNKRANELIDEKIQALVEHTL